MKSVSLASISEAIDYGLTASANPNPVGPKFLRITDIQDEAVDWEAVPFCAATPRAAASAELRTGDIVFARTGATTGKSYLIDTCPDGAVFASYLIRVRPSDKVDPRYLGHFFRSPRYWAQITSKARGAAQPGVNASKLKELEIPLPPLPEQQRIATILDRADALRRLRRQSLSHLSDLGQAIFYEMFGDPAANPKGFTNMTLRQIALKVSDGPFGSNLKSVHYVPEGIRVVRLQNIGVGVFLDADRAFISEEHFRRLAKHECLPGDILVGTLGDPNLRACLQPDWLKRSLNKADCVQIRVDPKLANNFYICALLNVPSVERMAHGLVLGQTRARISMGRLRDLPLPIAPKDMQEAFARRIIELDARTAMAESSLKQTESLFTSLQQRAFGGEL